MFYNSSWALHFMLIMCTDVMKMLFFIHLDTILIWICKVIYIIKMFGQL